MVSVEESLPFRWDLVTQDQLGSLLGGAVPPDLSFLEDLVACAGKVLAHSRNGDLVFVGRSLDSMFDLLGGVLAETVGVHRLYRLPLSFQRPPVGSGRRLRRRSLTGAEVAQGCRFLAAVGLTPYELSSSVLVRDTGLAFRTGVFCRCRCRPGRRQARVLP